MKSKAYQGKFLTSVSIGAAAVWFSTHCGAGFASGTQEATYFVQSGYLGPMMTFVSQIMMGVIVWVGLESARIFLMLRRPMVRNGMKTLKMKT